MIRVFHITTVHLVFDTRVFHRECRSLAETGKYEVTLVNAKGENLSRHGVTLKSVYVPRNRFERMTLTMLSLALFLLRNRADIYHFHDPELIPLAMILRLLGANVVYDCHEDYEQKLLSNAWLPPFFRKLASRLYAYLANLSFKSFSGVIVAAPSILERFEPQVINGVLSRNLPRLSQCSVEPAIPFHKRSNTVFYSGGVVNNKGIAQVIDAVLQSRVSDIELVIVGRADEPLYKKLESKLTSGRIRYLGVVPFEDVLHWMGRSKVGVVCNQPVFSYDRSLPNKLFEYMASGLPSVFSSFEQWTALSKNGPFGSSCDPSNPLDIRDKIDRLLMDDEYWNLIHASSLDVAQNFSWEREFLALDELYERVL